MKSKLTKPLHFKIKRQLLLLIALLLVGLYGCSNKVTVTCTRQKDMDYTISEHQQIKFKEAFDELSFDTPFDYYNDGKHTAYFSFIYYTIKSNGRTESIGIRHELSLVEYKRQTYIVDPYSELFDVVREIEVNNGYPQYGLLLSKDSKPFKFDLKSMYGDLSDYEKEKYAFSFDTWLSSGWTPVNELMQLMGLEDDNTSTLTELFISLSDDIIEINEEVFYKDIKIKCFQLLDDPDCAYGFLIKFK